ncbi:MAG: YlxM family DNA-binding protein [Erysipelothrix sp.]|nr:YlxM family DNA-binding protein [Erysipelothrix sp.]
MLQNNTYFNNLLAWYGTLLTDKQAEIMQSYYEDDLSISEIADNNGVSRAAVHDTLKRAQDILEHYENTLKMVSKFEQRQKYYSKLMDLDIIEVSDIVKRLEEIE